MNHKTKYTVMTIGLLLGICFFTIVITMYREDKFSKGDDSNVKVGDINREDESKENFNVESEDSVLEDSNDLSDISSTEKNSLNFSPEQIKELDLNFIKLADFLKIKDQPAINKLFEELYKAEPEERQAIFEKYKQNIGQVDDFSWVKEGMQAFKNLFINFFLVLKFICTDWVYFGGGWIAENLIRGKKNVNE